MMALIQKVVREVRRERHHYLLWIVNVSPRPLPRHDGRNGG